MLLTCINRHVVFVKLPKEKKKSLDQNCAWTLKALCNPILNFARMKQ